jgi:hypothetical protein
LALFLDQGLSRHSQQDRINIEQVRYHAFSDDRRLDLAQFEDQGGGNVILFSRRLADVKLPGLTVTVCKGFGSEPNPSLC